jgi:hypothetical protein
MTLSPETIARITAKVAAMTGHERDERCMELVDIPNNTEEEGLEFIKLLCGPDTTEQDFVEMLDEADPPNLDRLRISSVGSGSEGRVRWTCHQASEAVA